MEYNKFLLKMNLQDPTASILCLDYNSISAKQYDFIVDFSAYYGDEFIKNGTTIYWLPNLMYSVPLAKFLKATQTKDNKIVEEVNIEPQLIFTKEHLSQAMNLKSINIF